MSFYNYPEDPQTSDSSHVTVLSGVADDKWKILLRFSQMRDFNSGDVIVRALEKDDSVYILSKGSVEVLSPAGRSGPERSAVIEEGSVFGEVAFFDGRPRTATIRALTDGQLIRITREGFQEFAAWEPVVARQFLLDLGKVLALRLRSVIGMAKD